MTKRRAELAEIGYLIRSYQLHAVAPGALRHIEGGVGPMKQHANVALDFGVRGRANADRTPDSHAVD